MNANCLAQCLAYSMDIINISCYHCFHHLIFNSNGVVWPEYPKSTGNIVSENV